MQIDIRSYFHKSIGVEEVKNIPFTTPNLVARFLLLAFVVFLVTFSFDENVEAGFVLFFAGFSTFSILSVLFFFCKRRESVWFYWGMLISGIIYTQQLDTSLVYIPLLYSGVVVYYSSFKQNCVSSVLILIFYLVSEATDWVQYLFALTILYGFSFVIPIALRILVENKKQKDREHAAELQRRSRLAAENREELARELHDVVARELTIIALHASMAQSSEDEKVRSDAFELIGEQARSTLSELRRMVQTLRTEEGSAGDVPKLPSANIKLGQQVELMEKKLLQAGFQTVFEVVGQVDSVPDGLKPTVSMVLDEVQMNALKYSDVSHPVVLRVDCSGTWVRVESSNGIDQQKKNSGLTLGFGVLGVRERVQLLGGEVSTEEVDGIWRITVMIPTKKDT